MKNDIIGKRWKKIVKVEVKKVKSDEHRFGICPFCSYAGLLVSHHVIHRSEGGKNHRYNRLKLCRKCEQEVHNNKTLDNFIKVFYDRDDQSI